MAAQRTPPTRASGMLLRRRTSSLATICLPASSASSASVKLMKLSIPTARPAGAWPIASGTAAGLRGDAVPPAVLEPPLLAEGQEDGEGHEEDGSPEYAGELPAIEQPAEEHRPDGAADVEARHHDAEGLAFRSPGRRRLDEHVARRGDDAGEEAGQAQEHDEHAAGQGRRRDDRDHDRGRRERSRGDEAVVPGPVGEEAPG